MPEETREELVEQAELVIDAFNLYWNGDEKEKERWVLGWSPEALGAASLEIARDAGDDMPEQEQLAGIILLGIMVGLRLAERED